MVQNPIRFSIVIPLYNGERTIIRSVQSVLCQNYPYFELIVVDDGSTDKGLAGLQVINDPRLRILYQINSGVSAARNRGVNAAVNSWIAFLDADDEWESGYLEHIQTMIHHFPSCILMATTYYIGNEIGTKRAVSLKKLPFSDTFGLLFNYFEVALASNPPVCSSAVCIRKDKLLEIGGFPPGIKSGEDLLTWARLATMGDFAYCTKPLATYWQTKSHTNESLPARVPDKYDPVGRELLKLYQGYLGPQKKWLRKYIGLWHKMRASMYLVLNTRRPALQETLISLMYFPHRKTMLYLVLLFLPANVSRSLLNRPNNPHILKNESID